jgi:hypothetical protein
MLSAEGKVVASLGNVMCELVNSPYVFRVSVNAITLTHVNRSLPAMRHRESLHRAAVLLARRGVGIR